VKKYIQKHYSFTSFIDGITDQLEKTYKQSGWKPRKL
jgi:hypothetical protein